MKKFLTTADLSIPPALIDQVIGQERAQAIVRLAAQQRRFLLLVGEPGTGKSLLGRAVAELLPTPPDTAVAVVPHPEASMQPRVLVSSQTGLQQLLARATRQVRDAQLVADYLLVLMIAAAAIVGLWFAMRDRSLAYFLLALLSAAWLWKMRRPRRLEARCTLPKVLLNGARTQAPFIDATGLSEGALFGDVRHDPYQSGGHETAPHQLVEAGAVHRAHGGVLYIDEIGALSSESQRLLLTAIQDRALPITGRQSGSSGTLICTEAVPCDFVLVAACNPEDLASLSPALRSRFMGYGYEVLTSSWMADGPEQRQSLARFIAQEVSKDGRIPHFSAAAVEALIQAARERSGRKAALTLRLRELGGLVRSAGDLAAALPLVEAEHVRAALNLAASIEEQQRLVQEHWEPRELRRSRLPLAPEAEPVLLS